MSMRKYWYEEIDNMPRFVYKEGFLRNSGYAKQM